MGNEKRQDANSTIKSITKTRCCRKRNHPPREKEPPKKAEDLVGVRTGACRAGQLVERSRGRERREEKTHQIMSYHPR